MSLAQWNIQVFNLINGLAGKNLYLDLFMIFCAQFLILIVPISLMYFWLRGERRLAIFLLASVILATIISKGIGMLYYHPRPFTMNLTTPLISHSADSSFPSDHASLMFSFAIPFFFFKNYKRGIISLLLSILVGFARIYCGVHFPLDILGSFILALILSYILFVFRQELFSLFPRIIEGEKNSP